MDVDAVAAALRRRMLEKGMNKKELAAASGVHERTIIRYRNAQSANPDPVKLAKVSMALDWPSDGLQRIGDGGSPPEDAPEEMVRVPRSEIARLADEVRRLTEALGQPGRDGESDE